MHHAAADAAALWMLERGNRISARDLLATHEVRLEMYRSLGPILAAHDLFVCPTTAVPAVAAEQSPLGTIEIAGKTVPAHRGWILTYPFNMLGALPVMSVPSGRSRANVPIGLQLVGRPYDDAGVFAIAAAFERARGAWYVDEHTSPVVPG